jgi:CRP/FNR family transcriptional regulator, cyclic AMP receptor protein
MPQVDPREAVMHRAATAMPPLAQGRQVDLRILKTIPLFHSLSDPQLSVLLRHSQQHSYPRLTCVIREGQKTDAIYVIFAGCVKVTMHDANGKEIILAKLGPTEFFGEMGLLAHKARSATVETLEKCEILRFSRAGFMACFKHNFDVAAILVRNLIDRLYEADRKIESLAFLDVMGRVARVFLDQAQEVDGVWVVPNAPLKEEIAKTVAATREMVSRVVKELEIRGLIRYEKRKVFLLNREELPSARLHRKLSES